MVKLIGTQAIKSSLLEGPVREMYFRTCLSVKVVSERIKEGVEELPFASQTADWMGVQDTRRKGPSEQCTLVLSFLADSK